VDNKESECLMSSRKSTNDPHTHLLLVPLSRLYILVLVHTIALREQGLDDMINPQMPQIRICLSAPYKQDWLTSDISHTQCRTDFIVLSISQLSRAGEWYRVLTIVSNLVKMIPSIPLFLCAPPIPALEKSLSARSNFVS
jgi:hypothetical protein